MTQHKRNGKLALRNRRTKALEQVERRIQHEGAVIITLQKKEGFTVHSPGLESYTHPAETHEAFGARKARHLTRLERAKVEKARLNHHLSRSSA